MEYKYSGMEPYNFEVKTVMPYDERVEINISMAQKRSLKLRLRIPR